MLEDELTDRNWNITRIGAASVLVIAAVFLSYMWSSLPFKMPVAMAAGAGLVFAAAAKVGDLDKLKTLMQPLSGFLNMVAGALLVASAIFFLSNSIEMIIETLEQFSGDSIVGLIRSLILPVMGYITVLFGSFIAATGSGMVYWDRVDERVPVGAGRKDFMFTVILGALTAFGIFGTAVLKQLPVGEYIGIATEILFQANSIDSVVAGALVFAAYRGVRMAWASLPIRESVPRDSRETYDKLKKPELVVRWLIIPVIAILTAAQGFVSIKYLQYFAPLTAPSVRKLLAAATVVGIAIFVAIKLLKILTGDREKIKWLIPYTVFGAVAYISAPYFTESLNQVTSRLPEFAATNVEPFISAVGATQAVMILMTAASAFAVILKIFMGILRGFGIVPKGLEGTTLVASGIFFSSVGLNLYAPNPVVLFVGVGLSMASWEIGKRSVILGREVGRSGSTYKAELVQVVSKLVLVFVAVVAARTFLIAANNLNFTVPEGSTGYIVFLLAVTGVGLLAASLKNYT